jgi:hypothetical protein
MRNVPKTQENDVVALRAAPECDVTPNHASLDDEQSAIVALVDELATLAADLWLEGKLDAFPLIEEPDDEADE